MRAEAKPLVSVQQQGGKLHGTTIMRPIGNWHVWLRGTAEELFPGKPIDPKYAADCQLVAGEFETEREALDAAAKINAGVPLAEALAGAL